MTNFTNNNETKNIAVNSLEGYVLTLRYWVSRDSLESAMRASHSETNRTVTVVVDKPELIIKALETATSLTISCQARDRAALKAGVPYTDHYRLSDLVDSQRAKKPASNLSAQALECLKIHKKLVPMLGVDGAIIALATKYPKEVIEELRAAGNISA